MQNTDKNNKANKSRKSMTLSVLGIYKSFVKKIYNSASYRFFRWTRKFSFSAGNIKRKFASGCENSRIISVISGSVVKLLEKDMRYYGVAMFFFGIFVMAFSSLRHISLVGADYAFGRDESFGLILPGVLAILFSVMLMSSKKSLAAQLCESRIMSFLLFDIFCFDRKYLKKIPFKNHTHTFPVIIGIVLSLPAVFLSVSVLIRIFCTLIFVYLVLKKPENGVIFVFLTLPFAGSDSLFGIVAFVCVAYLLKVFRNKRVFKFGIFDITVIFFAAVVLLCGIISIRDTGSAGYSLKIIFAILFGLVISNAVKSTALAQKCINSVIISFSIAAFAGTVTFIIGTYGLSDISFIFTAVYDLTSFVQSGTDGLLYELTPLVIPFVLVKLSRYCEPSVRLRSFVSLIFLTAFSVFTLDITVWFTFAVGIIAYFCIRKRTLIPYVVAVAAIFALAVEFVPALSQLLRDVLSYVTDYQAKSAYHVQAAGYVSDIISRFGLAGIGSSDEALQRVFACLFGNESVSAYPYLSFVTELIIKYGIVGLISAIILYGAFVMSGMEFYMSEVAYRGAARLNCASCVASVSAVFIRSLFFPTFITYEAVLFIFMIMYIGISLSKSERREYVPDLFDLPAAL